MDGVFVGHNLERIMLLVGLLLLFFDRDQGLRKEGLVGEVVVIGGKEGGRHILLFLELERYPFGGDAHLLALHSDGLDGVAETNNLLLHFLRLAALLADDGLEERFFGVELHVWQFADIQQRQLFFH